MAHGKRGDARHRAAEVLTAFHLLELPAREELMAQARAMFASTTSLDEIVDRAYELVLHSIGMRLVVAVEG